ncbi:PREDICTED: WD repeat-containing protein 55-like isoform X1 [Amphimedon queenslandica]|uniref:Uncharacterized protein n=2 Tax=Amphimedon queenslandica TaxID=400682 RepID=A0A1X7UR65_AMPQE|nr:PREDICTED: WD repeat-containing protein 55-like isoform X1 [Amphimedon queenslandica]XP_019852680.1 PREDICTED: WD repeat-containing protein 55-like isoform X1 [Amphimedon queenslandica]|eukprot:XP_019852679.1 PREDICTED: WD repeat-containing protein 55-like isoform X1 [Amphimedon queenslandica]
MSQGGAAPPCPHISFHDENLLAIDSHPLSPLLACGTMDGQVLIYSTKDYVQQTQDLRISSDSCRSLRFSKSGKTLYCGLKDKSIQYIDVNSFKVSFTIPNAHHSSLNSLHVISERLVATGDDEGCVKVWDARLRKEVFSVTENTDFISDMASSIEKQTLLCTSGDGSLSAVDLRQRKLEQRSDCSESELLCITLVKGGAKIVTGDAEGVLGIFTWGLWGDVIDRYPLTLRSQSIDSSIQISDSVVCAGGLDGIIRVVQILPNKTICELGRHHGSECSYPVEELRLSHDKTHLLSSSYDQVNSWPIGDLPKVWIGGGRREKEEQEEEEEEEQEDVKERRRGGKKSRRKRRRKELLAGSQPPKKRDTFFDDL